MHRIGAWRCIGRSPFDGSRRSCDTRSSQRQDISNFRLYDVLMFSLRAGDGFSSSYHNTIGCDAREDCLFVADGLILLASLSHVGLDDIPTTFISENWKRVPPDDGWGTQARKGESAGCIKVQSWEPPDILVMNLNDRTIQVVDGLQEQKGRWSEPGPIRIDEVRIADSVGDNPGDEYARSKERVDAYSLRRASL
jgi:hypothetical protein